jgi:hypothetical protein
VGFQAIFNTEAPSVCTIADDRLDKHFRASIPLERELALRSSDGIDEMAKNCPQTFTQ